MLFLKETGKQNSVAILFLHAIGTSSWMWKEITDTLTDFHCICIDLPGHGHSADVKWESLEKTSNDVMEMLNNIVPNKKIHIVGLSFGAFITISLSSKFPEKFESIYLSGLNIMPIPYNKTIIKVIGKLILPFIKCNIFIKQNAKMLNIPKKHFNDYKKAFLQFDKKSFWDASLEIIDFKLTNDVKNSQIRKIFLAGSKESQLILDSLLKAQNEIYNSKAYIIENCGHGWSGEKPNIFAQSVKAWVLNQTLPFELKEIS